MRWVPFAILALVTIVFQTTIVPMTAVRSVWPEWTFILAVHYALWGPWPDAAIAAWLLGLLVDLQSAPPDPIGLHAFCYGACAWAIIRIRSALFRDHPVTHGVVTLVFAFAMQLVIGLYRSWRLSEEGGYEGWVLPAFLTALYTAVWAPLLCWPLIRMGRWTGLRPAREV
jgi:rod shape-determining protein MreD